MVLARSDRRLRAVLLDLLGDGGVAIAPCDTIYGFVGRAPDTGERIRRIKGRGETKPFLMLVGSVEQASEMAERPIDPGVTALWPAALTIIMRTRQGTAGVRLPDDPFLTDVAENLGAPVYSTSVNRSGSEALWRIGEIVTEFENEVDLIVDGGDLPGGLPSTILDITQTPYRILRQGEFQVPGKLLARE